MVLDNRTTTSAQLSSDLLPAWDAFRRSHPNALLKRAMLSGMSSCISEECDPTWHDDFMKDEGRAQEHNWIPLSIYTKRRGDTKIDDGSAWKLLVYWNQHLQIQALGRKTEDSKDCNNERGCVGNAECHPPCHTPPKAQIPQNCSWESKWRDLFCIRQTQTVVFFAIRQDYNRQIPVFNRTASNPFANLPVTLLIFLCGRNLYCLHLDELNDILEYAGFEQVNSTQEFDTDTSTSNALALSNEQSGHTMKQQLFISYINNCKRRVTSNTTLFDWKPKLQVIYRGMLLATRVPAVTQLFVVKLQVWVLWKHARMQGSFEETSRACSWEQAQKGKISIFALWWVYSSTTCTRNTAVTIVVKRSQIQEYWKQTIKWSICSC